MKPGLFGVSGRSNRDNANKSHWGKNEFNSSFPTSLLCYMSEKKINPVYLKLDKSLKVVHDEISTKELFGISPKDDNIYFSFEDSFVPFQGYVTGQLPRSDLVIMDKTQASNPWKHGFEIKLTALPDNTTYDLTDDKYSCEMVFRPTAIVHLALSIASIFNGKKKQLLKILSPVCSKIFNWRSKTDIVQHTTAIVDVLNTAFISLIAEQKPFIIQPIWKTKGKACILHDHCLDTFIWSDLAFTRLFFDIQYSNQNMVRPQRCIFWLARMLYDYAHTGVINPALIASEMAYELQTDKAFSVPGNKSWHYLNCESLTKPRIKKEEMKNIIIGGGQNCLSPERRFDAAIVNTPGLFN